MKTRLRTDGSIILKAETDFERDYLRDRYGEGFEGDELTIDKTTLEIKRQTTVIDNTSGSERRGRQPKFNWNGVNWKRSTMEVSQSLNCGYSTASKMRKKLAPETIGMFDVRRTRKRTARRR